MEQGNICHVLGIHSSSEGQCPGDSDCCTSREGLMKKMPKKTEEMG